MSELEPLSEKQLRMATAVRKITNNYYRHRIPLDATYASWRDIVLPFCPERVKLQLAAAEAAYVCKDPAGAAILERDWGGLINEWMGKIRFRRRKSANLQGSDKCLVILPDRTWWAGTLLGNVVHLSRRSKAIPTPNDNDI